MFLIHDDGRLVEMREQPYDSEDLLQRLLAEYPSILAGDQIDSSAPRRWLLIRREAPVPMEEGGAGRWSLDHLLLDQDGIPTLVETKRSSDTRIRREVVGQMLDYAANAVVYWPIESVRAWLEARCVLDGLNSEVVLTEFLGPSADPDSFWQRVKDNLLAGRVRLVFVADHIPVELLRIVEFLNTQMDPAEVLAVEVPQYLGEGLKTIVPRVLGRTAAAQQRKGGPSRGPSRAGREWDEASFLEDLEARKGAFAVQIAKQFIAWATREQLRCTWGTGAVDGSFGPFLDHRGIPYSFVRVRTNGLVEIGFGDLKRRAPFNDESLRTELLRRFNGLPEVDLQQDKISGWPNIPLSVFQRPDVLEQFTRVLDWALAQIRAQ